MLTEKSDSFFLKRTRRQAFIFTSSSSLPSSSAMGRSARTLAFVAALLLCDTALVGVEQVAAAAAASACPTILKPSYDDPVVGSGWTAQLIAQGLVAPRGIAFDKNGALLVVQQGSGIVHMTFTDNGGTCLIVNQTRAVVNNTDVSPFQPTPPTPRGLFPRPALVGRLAY